MTKSVEIRKTDQSSTDDIQPGDVLIFSDGITWVSEIDFSEHSDQ